MLPEEAYIFFVRYKNIGDVSVMKESSTIGVEADAVREDALEKTENRFLGDANSVRKAGQNLLDIVDAVSIIFEMG